MITLDCGHAPGSVDGSGKSVCTACYYKDTGHDLTGRLATCTDCRKQTSSNPNLAFFDFNEAGRDTYYCGCRGWD
jgi:hypothetical protein